MGRYCSVPGCSTDSKNSWDKEGRRKVVFKFPYKNENLFEKWLKNIPETLKDGSSRHARICEDHFEQRFKIEDEEGLVKLRQDAYPTIFLGTEDYFGDSRKSSKLLRNPDNCRFCLCKINGDHIKITESIEKRIQCITQIHLKMSDLYASSICTICHDNLNISYTFRRMVIENQNKLYNAFDTIEMEGSQDSDAEEPSISYPIKHEMDEFENVEIKVENEEYSDGFPIVHGVFDQFQNIEGQDFHDWTLGSYVSDSRSDRKRRKSKLSRKSEKPKVDCPYTDCGKSFRAHSLRAHIDRIHKRIKNYECDLCGHQAYYKKSLLFHFLAIHLKEKNFNCQECDKDFSTPGSLINHRFTVHEKRSYKKQDKFDCSQCFKTFAKKYSLDRHILKVHFQVRINEHRSEEAKSKKKEKLV
jgi:hypothetical protein